LNEAINSGQPFSEPNVVSIFHSLIQGLVCLHTHSEPIIHGDISLGNLLIKKNITDAISIVLSEFDVAMEAKCKGIEFVTHVRKCKHWAPEIATSLYDTPADIWSAGVVMYCIMAMVTEKQLLTVIQLLNSVESQREQQKVLRVPLEGVYSDELIDLVLSMFAFLPQDRPSAQAIFESINELKNNGIRLETVKIKENTGVVIRDWREVLLEYKLRTELELNGIFQISSEEQERERLIRKAELLQQQLNREEMKRMERIEIVEAMQRSIQDSYAQLLQQKEQDQLMPPQEENWDTELEDDESEEEKVDWEDELYGKRKRVIAPLKNDDVIVYIGNNDERIVIGEGMFQN
jgi:serine/threonine protein kinase